jgi:hypothetical protein
MNKKLCCAGMLGMVLAFGLVIVGCDSGGGGGGSGDGGGGGIANIEGQWIGSVLLNFTVSSNTVVVSGNGVTTNSRAFTSTGTTLTINNMNGTGNNYTFNYAVSGNTLTLTLIGASPYTVWDGIFSRPFTSPTLADFQGGIWHNIVSPQTTYSFSGSNYLDNQSNGTVRSGTFTFTSTDMTLHQTSPSTATHVEKYWISSTHFFLASQSTAHDYGPFKK